MRTPYLQRGWDDVPPDLPTALNAWAAKRPALVEAARLGKLHEEAEDASRASRKLLLDAAWMWPFSDAAVIAAEVWRAAVHAEAIAENLYIDAVRRSDDEDQRARVEEPADP